MAELESQFMEVVSISGLELRKSLEGPQAGVIAAGDLKVTAGGVGLSVDVAAGGAYVRGSSVVDQGLYRIINDATKNSSAFEAGGIPNNSSGLPRLDQVIARQYDQSHDGSGLRKWRLEILAGVATSGATLDNRNGAAALPASSLRLIDYLVPTGASSILAGNIRDRRSWAWGLNSVISLTAGTLSTTSGSFSVLTGTQIRAELSGVPIEAKIWGQNQHSTGANSFLEFFLDGVVFGADGTGLQQSIGTVLSHQGRIQPVHAPVAGSHLLDWRSATSGGTLSYAAAAANPLYVSYQEILRQNANNS